MKEIAKFFAEVIYDSPKYNTPNSCNDTDLLYPPFYEKIKKLETDYLEVHETPFYILETYRSNTLQQIYFNRGASQIRSNGMHHYGIAVDLVAKINGKVRYDVLDYAWIRDYVSKDDNLWLKEGDMTMLNFEDAHIQYIRVSQQNELRHAVVDEMS